MHIKVAPTIRAHLLPGLAIFLLAFGVRVLSWHDTRLEVGKVQTVVVGDYQRVAQLLRGGGIGSFLSSSSPLADLNNLGHPPGYSILIALVGSSNNRIQFVQMIADALAAVMIFLIVAELLPLSAGAIAGLLAAFSPQFAWNAVLLLPDSISVLPILIAILLIARAAKNPRLLTFVVAGALIGISCWLRANLMLLTFFVAAAVPLLIRKSKDASTILANRPRDASAPIAQVWRFTLAVIAGTLLIVLPLTIRNAIVFRRFIPLSLGAGQTFLEGIADYDREGRFGIPQTDMGIMKQESEIYQRPDYYGTLFNPDGVERERARISRAFGVIRSHPFWFGGVMARRASSMVRLERARLISIEPPVSHSLDTSAKIAKSKSPAEIFATGMALSPQTKFSLVSESEFWLAVNGDDSNYGDQFAIPIETVNGNVDYSLSVPIKVETGRMKLRLKGASGRIYASTVLEALETLTAADQPVREVSLPFLTNASEPLQIVLSNEASNPPRPVAHIGAIKLFELGPSSFLWTRYPRFVIHGVQKMFITAVILPLAIIGLLILIFQKQSRALVVLSIVPLYFFTVQSIVHTEYRYVLAVDYFLFALVGVAVASVLQFIIQNVKSTRHAGSLPSA